MDNDDDDDDDDDDDMTSSKPSSTSTMTTSSCIFLSDFLLLLCEVLLPSRRPMVRCMTLVSIVRLPEAATVSWVVLLVVSLDEATAVTALAGVMEEAEELVDLALALVLALTLALTLAGIFFSSAIVFFDLDFKINSYKMYI